MERGLFSNREEDLPQRVRDNVRLFKERISLPKNTSINYGCFIKGVRLERERLGERKEDLPPGVRDNVRLFKERISLPKNPRVSYPPVLTIYSHIRASGLKARGRYRFGTRIESTGNTGNGS